MPHRISKGHATATSPKPPRPIERSVPSPRRRRRRNPSSFLLLRHGHRLAHSAGGLLHRVRRRPGLCHHPPLPAKLRPPAQHQGTPQLQQHRRRADRRRRVVRLPRRSPPLRRRRRPRPRRGLLPRRGRIGRRRRLRGGGGQRSPQR